MNSRFSMVYAPALVLAACVFLVGGGFWAMVGSLNQKEQEYKKAVADAAASWDRWEREVTAQDCRIDTFLPTTHGYPTRPIWRCPDGRVLLGRPQ